LKPDEVSDLRLRLPKGVSGHTNLRIAPPRYGASPRASCFISQPAFTLRSKEGLNLSESI
jgi:hypothetical protein